MKSEDLIGKITIEENDTEWIRRLGNINVEDEKTFRNMKLLDKYKKLLEWKYREGSSTMEKALDKGIATIEDIILLRMK